MLPTLKAHQVLWQACVRRQQAACTCAATATDIVVSYSSQSYPWYQKASNCEQTTSAAATASNGAVNETAQPSGSSGADVSKDAGTADPIPQVPKMEINHDVSQVLPADYLKGSARLVPPKATPLKWVAVALGGIIGGISGYIALRETGLYHRLPGTELPVKYQVEQASQALNDFDDVRHHVRRMLRGTHPILQLPSSLPIETVPSEVIRLVVHAAFTYEADGLTGGTNLATFRFAPEREYAYNTGAETVLNMLEPLKIMYPWASYADLYVAAAVECVAALGGPQVSCAFGRDDAETYRLCVPDKRPLTPSSSPNDVYHVASRMGLTPREAVALLGFAHPATKSPTNQFSNVYFTMLISGKAASGTRGWVDGQGNEVGQLDMGLVQDKELRSYVEEFAGSEEVCREAYGAALGKALGLGVEGPRRQVED